MAKRQALAGAMGLALLLGTSWASAYCRTRGCDTTSADEDCEYDAQGCLASGPILHWPSSCVSFSVQEDASTLRGISYDAARDAIEAGFAQWLSADCGGGVAPGMSVSDYGPVECGEAEYNQDAGNANVFMFRDEEWPYDNAIDTLALTTLIFNAENGEIYDADVEVNTFESTMSIGNVGRSDIDFASVITHEIGHFLGLSHSNVAGSTMRPSYAPGNTAMASIEEDDAAGICAVLEPGRAVRTETCEPRHGFASECALEHSSGCQASGGRGANGLAAALMALLGLGLRRRALRRQS
jgi:hypothetical protein